MVKFIQHLLTREDEHGARRGLWIGYDEDGQAVEMHNEVGEEGRKPLHFREKPELLAHHIRVRDYHHLLAFGERKGWLRSE